jgi:hypothetical protein
VLAHEFGHYHGGDTRLGPFIYRTREAIERVLHNASRQSAFLQLPFLWYGRMFLRVTQAISRRQELTADELAARTFGSHSMIEGLRALARGSVAWNAYWRTEVVPLLEAGFQPPVTEGFERFIRELEIWREADRAAQKMLAEARPDPYDSHPPDSERIAALAALPPGPAGATGRQLPAEQARSLGVGLAGAAVAVALADHGWVAESLPGRPVVMRNGEAAIEPFADTNRLSRGEIDTGAWQRRCSDLGVGDLPLEPSPAG